MAALAAAEDAEVMAEWAGLGYYARARNLLKCARAVVADHGGRFPGNARRAADPAGDRPLHRRAIAAIAYDEPATVVDGNVERVMARLYLVETPLPAAKAELTRLAAALTPQQRPGDYAQAVMDLGATICTPRNPACGICPWRAPCPARAEGMQADLPRKAAKAAKPVRQGTVWIARRADGALLLETRPERGLLGGMLGWPGDDWDGAGGPAPLRRRLAGGGRGAPHLHPFPPEAGRCWWPRCPQDAAPDRGDFRAAGRLPARRPAHGDAQGL